MKIINYSKFNLTKNLFQMMLLSCFVVTGIRITPVKGWQRVYISKMSNGYIIKKIPLGGESNIFIIILIKESNIKLVAQIT